MIVERIFCDRCGRICENIKDSHGFRLMKQKHYLEKWKNGTPEKLDLCQRCYNSLSEWMKSDNTESENMR